MLALHFFRSFERSAVATSIHSANLLLSYIRAFFSLHQSIYAEHEASQAASTVFQVIRMTRLWDSTQGRNEVKWRRGQEASLASPCSNLRSFGSKFTVLKKVLVTLLGLFGYYWFSDSTPGGLCPPRYAPDSNTV